MNDAKLAAAQAMASFHGRDWATLSDDAKAFYLDLSGAALCAAAPPPKAAEPERSIRVLRGFVEILTVKDGKRGNHPLRCSCRDEGCRIAGEWSRGSDWQPGSGLPIFELGLRDPEPDGDADGYFIREFMEDETGRRV